MRRENAQHVREIRKAEQEMQLHKLAEWGVDDLFGTMFEWERYGLLILGQATDSAGVSGCARHTTSESARLRRHKGRA